jgi:hypothetical protein
MSKLKENDYILYLDKYIFFIVSISDKSIFTVNHVAKINDNHIILYDKMIHYFGDQHMVMVNCKKLPTDIKNQYLKLITFQ